jgi:tetratricopeptide (TPR) repeat protein
MGESSAGLLAKAIQLRESGRDEEARTILLGLFRESPTDPVVNYQCGWIHDKLGLEKEAVPFYVTAIEGGLPDADLRGALLGLGSTYRALGQYELAAQTLERGDREFPEAPEFKVFLAMAFYNLGRHHDAVRLLLRTVAETGQAGGIERLREPILFYSEHLDETW